MAYEVNRQDTITLGSMVQDGINAFAAARNRARAARSSEFYQRVIDEGLKAEEQVAYFEGWLKEEQNKPVSDKAFVDKMKQNVAELKKQARAEKFHDEYQIAYQQYKTGKKSVDDHIRFLNQQLDEANDPELKNTINGYITTAKVEKVNIEKNILSNKVTFAMNDKRQESLFEAINSVKGTRGEALSNGDKEYASSLDLQLQALNSQLQNVKISDEIHELDIKMSSSKFTPVKYLKELNSIMRSADSSDVPITINGKRYDNAQQYWQFEVNKYVEQDFFTLLKQEYDNEINTANAKLKPVLEGKIAEQYREIEALKQDPSLAPYVEKLEQLQVSNVSYGVDLLGQKIVRDYDNGMMGDTANKNIDNTINKLRELNNKYGVDVSANLNAVVSDVVQKKEAASNQQVKNYMEALAEGKTPEEAWNYAETSSVATNIPGEDYLTQTPSDISKSKIDALEKTGTENASPYDIGQSKVEESGQKVSSEPEVGEYIANPELLKYVNPEDTIKQGDKFYLKPGVTSPFRKVTGQKDLEDLGKQYGLDKVEDYLIRPEGSKDIYVKQ